MKEFKEKIDKSVDIIVSCWDENNPNDGLTFDERLERKIQDEQDPQIKRILQKSKT